MPSVQSTPLFSSTNTLPRTDRKRPVAQASKATLFQGVDTVRFGKRDKHNRAEPGEFTTGEKWKGGAKAMFKSLADWKWWAKEGAIACAITLATCWLPGSQLFTIPLWLIISGMFTHGQAFMNGFRNPDSVNAPSEPKRKHSDDGEWTTGEKAKAAAKGALKHGIKAFTWKDGDLLQNLGISALLTLATCWLPGSQLLTIPAWFCMDAAIKAGRGAYVGWQHPGLADH